jgi:NAD(P)-dependent dehydrogenase (short-subunit alcohol dehydrogenase family)
VRLAKKIALITGGATGIGRAIALRFAQEGAQVVIADINTAAGEATATQAQGRFVLCNTAQSEQAQAAVAATLAAFGGVDVLVNAAAHLGGMNSVETMPEDEWRAVLSVTLDGVYYCSKYAVLEMIKRGVARSSTSPRWKG